MDMKLLLSWVVEVLGLCLGGYGRDVYGLNVCVLMCCMWFVGGGEDCGGDVRVCDVDICVVVFEFFYKSDFVVEYCDIEYVERVICCCRV